MKKAAGAWEMHAVCLLLAGAMCLLPFLIPYHQLPVLSFYPEWLAVGLGACAALGALASRGAPASAFPSPAQWLAAVALYFAARMAGAEPGYPQTSLLAARYAVYAVLMLWLGAQLANALGRDRVAIVLAAGLLAGAIANALAGAIQFYGRPLFLEDLVAELHGRRAYGNLAQPNLYANYLAVGQTALLFLWTRFRIPAGCAVPIAVLLAVGSALSGSRGALVFAGWIALIAALGARIHPGLGDGRLKPAAYLVAACILVAHFGVPWINDALGLGRAGEGTFERLEALPGQAVEPRWHIFSLGWRVFGTAPLLGVGIGRFPGAAFEAGLAPDLTRAGEVLTSPHDLPLHLLAEAGIAGFALVLASLVAWARRVARALPGSGLPAWWLVAATGVELIHSSFEFPLWSANFLGMTALLMGVCAALAASPRPMSGPGRLASIGSCVALLLVLAVLLRDYVRLDTTRVTGASTMALAGPADARRDAATLRELRRGLLGPLAELWIFSGTPPGRGDLDGDLAMSARVATFWPSNAVIVRRAVLLALAGEDGKARSLLGRALLTFPHSRAATVAMLESAVPADPRALQPL